MAECRNGEQGFLVLIGEMRKVCDKILYCLSARKALRKDFFLPQINVKWKLNSNQELGIP